MGDEAIHCRECALRLLARREHSMVELQRKLEARAFNAGQIKQTLLALCQQNLQSDARYAETCARNASEKGRGPVYIRHYLNTRGVSAEQTDTALAVYNGRWPRLAAAARSGKFGDAPPPDRRQRHKQLQFLLRRGFTAEQAQQALGSCRIDDVWEL